MVSLKKQYVLNNNKLTDEPLYEQQRVKQIIDWLVAWFVVWMAETLIGRLVGWLVV